MTKRVFLETVEVAGSRIDDLERDGLSDTQAADAAMGIVMDLVTGDGNGFLVVGEPENPVALIGIVPDDDPLCSF